MTQSITRYSLSVDTQEMSVVQLALVRFKQQYPEHQDKADKILQSLRAQQSELDYLIRS